jgi:hypothetical protein
MLIYVKQILLAYKLSYTNIPYKQISIMKTKKIVTDDRPRFKVQIDYKTIITVRTMEAVKSWIQRYPAAKLVD